MPHISTVTGSQRRGTALATEVAGLEAAAAAARAAHAEVADALRARRAALSRCDEAMAAAAAERQARLGPWARARLSVWP